MYVFLRFALFGITWLIKFLNTFNFCRILISLLFIPDFGIMYFLFLKWSVYSKVYRFCWPFQRTNFSSHWLFSVVFWFFFHWFPLKVYLCFKFTLLFLLRWKLKMIELRPFFFSHEVTINLVVNLPLNSPFTGISICVICSFSFISKKFF